jgi:predicted ATP-grasp superfamily ATP-dependent carboligase
MTQRPPAIIIGGDSANGLGITHSLASYGIDVYCVTSNPYELALFSKYCKRAAVIPGIEQDPGKLRQFLEALAPQLPGVGVLFPTTDFAVPTVAEIQHQLPQYVTFVADKTLIDVMVDKQRFYASLSEHGIPHPRVIAPEKMALEQIANELGFPLYLRPALSRDFTIAFGVKGFIARTVDTLREYLALAANQGFDMMVQEVIPGPTNNGYSLRGYFDQQACLRTYLWTQKIRQPSMISNVSINKSILVTPESSLATFQQAFVTYFSTLKYRGLFGAEVKVDSRDGEVKLMEVNPRTMGGCYMSTMCGVNDIFAAYQDALGQPLSENQSYQTGIYAVNVVTDLMIILRRLLQGQPVRHVLRPYLQNWFLHGLYNRDWLPFIINVLVSLANERRKYRHRAS